MTTIDRLWPESTVACLATGPSLTAADVEACRGRVRTIAVNDAWRLAPWADVLYSSDQDWFPKYKGVPDFHGLKVVIRTERKRWQEEYGLIALRSTGLLGLESSPNGLRSGKNSGYAAINLAVHLGARRILLLGYDMQRDRKGRGHFFGEHPPGLNNTRDETYQQFRDRFVTLVKPLAERGIEVVNCTPGSALACFPKASLLQTLEAWSPVELSA